MDVRDKSGSSAVRAGGKFSVRGLRWWIIGLVFLATVINFLDRQTISILGPVIMEKLKLSELQFASITTWFLLAYTISQGLSGRLYDRVGTKMGFTVSIVVWSISAMAHGLAQGLRSLCTCRVFLGFGEAGNWPGAAKAIAEWFPVRERAFAMGIFNSGVTVGMFLAVPSILWLNVHFGWKATFVVTGILGFLWLAAWLVLYYPLASHPWVREEERKLIQAGQQAALNPGRDAEARWRWRELMQYRQVWSIVLARLLVDPVWWLFIIWLPTYLNKVRGLKLNMKEMAGPASIPFVAAGVGSLLGGWISGYLIRRGWSVNRARKTVIIAAALLMPAGILAVRADGLGATLGWICLVTFGFQVWINNVQTLPSDLFPQKAVASVAGMGGVGAGIGSMIFTLTTGWVVQHFSYKPIFTVAGILAPMGTVVLLALVGRVRQVEIA